MQPRLQRRNSRARVSQLWQFRMESHCQPGPARLIQSASDKRQFTHAVRVGIDRDEDAGGRSAARIVRGKIEPVGAGVDFEKTAVGLRMVDDAVHIDVVAGPLEQQPAGGVAQDVEIAVVHRAHDALGLLLAVQPEARVDRTNRIVELPQEIVRIIQRPVSEDIHLGRFEDPDALRSFIELVDISDLRPQIFDGDAARDFQALRVIRDSDIFISAFSCSRGHLLDRMRAVARCGMRVQFAADIGGGDKRRQRSLPGASISSWPSRSSGSI